MRDVSLTRREMLALALAGAATPASAEDLTGRICLFTDHLAGFEWKEVARMLRQLGVSGPDLTVRKGGLVEPDRVVEDLPKAADAFREEGLSIPMITTNILSVDDPLTNPLLSTAARVGVRHYKLGYYAYGDLAKWQSTIAGTQRELAKLAALNQKLGLRAGMHNHAGNSVGCALWDSWEAMKGVDPKQVGFYFDPAQASIEGGKTGWNLGFRRLSERIFMVAIKDYVWEKSDKGWRTRWVPLGQGMVQFPAFFELLRASRFQGPISLHIEYDPGGATKGARYERSLEAADRDLRFLKNLLRRETA